MVWNFSLWSKIQCNWKYRGIVDSVILIFPYLSWLCLCIKQRARSFSSSINHLKGYCKRHQKCSVSPQFPSNTNTQLHWWILTCGEIRNLFQKVTKRLRIRYCNYPFFHRLTPFNTDEWDCVECELWWWDCEGIMRSVILLIQL